MLCYFSPFVTYCYDINVHFWSKVLPTFYVGLFLTPSHVQVSVSKARTIIVLAEDGNADQVRLSYVLRQA